MNRVKATKQAKSAIIAPPTPNSGVSKRGGKVGTGGVVGGTVAVVDGTGVGIGVDVKVSKL
jgi:hypothetical protein